MRRNAGSLFVTQWPKAKPPINTAIPARMELNRLKAPTAPTQEPLDPVRYISNRSSGKMGYALAEAAAARGARVILVSGPVHLPPPRGVELKSVRTAVEMREKVFENLGVAGIVIKAAAVADFGKIHISGFLAWLSWLFIHIFFLIGFRNRLIVLIQWAWSYLTYERGARLITGDTHLPGWDQVRAENVKAEVHTTAR